MAFTYRPRSAEDWEARANQGGMDYENFTYDEFRKFTAYKGENHIRILPPTWDGAPHYGLDCYVHYSVGPSKRDSVVCLDQGLPQIGIGGKPCPICQEWRRVQKTDDEDMAREYRPVKRVLTWVLDKKDEGKGVLLWSMPYTVDKDINQISKNRARNTWYDIDDPKSGFDIYFRREGEALNTKYNGFERDSEPSAVAQKHIDWVEAHPLPKVVRLRDYDEVKRLFEGRGRGDNSAASDDDEEPRATTRHGTSTRSSFTPSEREEPQTAEELREEEPAEERRPTRNDEGRQTTRAPMRRPRADANGADDTPFDGSRPRAAQSNDKPSGSGAVRADEVRDRFLKRRT